MAKKSRTQKSAPAKSKKTGRTKSAAPAATDSFAQDILDIAAKTNVLKQNSAKIAKKSEQFQQEAAYLVRHGIEEVHQTAHENHKQIEATHEKVHRGLAKQGRPPKALDEKSSLGFLTVGIGASAGGFEAFMQLLERIRPDTGMAFVFVQHLDPAHKSNLTSLLARSTRMKIEEIHNKTPLLPNRIYIIPPNKALEMKNGVLLLTPRAMSDGPHLPINAFFKSLAADQGARAVGVVLSGNASDGTEGLQAIKAQGGITFAQDTVSAKFKGMPQSAATSGVDFVMPPAQIARELQRIARRGVSSRGVSSRGVSSRGVSSRGEDKAPEVELPGTDQDLHQLFGLMRKVTGVDFTHYKPTTLKRRISRRMVLKKIETLKGYIKFLKDHPHEVELLFDDVLINVTGFFRDPGAFLTLKRKVFPRILKRGEKNIRIWVPGCATGEEVYSLAICLHEFLGKNVQNRTVQIFGTDISNAMVTKARAGIYAKSIAAEVSLERRRRYFKKYGSGYRISKFIRDCCIFARQNVAQDPPFSKMDLISCRNLLIYLDTPLQKKVLPIFHYSLRSGGCLFLGTSETIGNFSTLFTLIDKPNKIYVRDDSFVRGEMEFAPASYPENAESSPAIKTEPGRFDLQKRAEDILLSQFTPPSIIIGSRMEVLHFRGRTGPYLEPASGTASLDVLKIVRGELIGDLRTAIMQASRTNELVRKEHISMRSRQEVTLEVMPIKGSPMRERFFLILFRPVAAEDSVHIKGKPASGPQRQAERHSQRLRDELSQTKDSLQTIIEEQDATNEELKSANEEIQSSNEELQSTNEELETAKEELQSTNEELTTLNEELQNRNADLSQANDDLNNLISSFNMPIVILSNDLIVRRITPMAQKHFNLLPGDIGRQLRDINPNIPFPDLTQHVKEVISSLNTKEIEVQDLEGHWYSLRIRPYRTAENKIDGAVLVLVDIGEVRQGLEEVTDIVPLPMLLLSADLRVSRANDAFYKKFSVNKNETEGHLIFRLGNGQWSNPALRTMLESILPANNKVENYILEHDFPQLGLRTFRLNARRLYEQSKGTHYILLIMQEVPPSAAPQLSAATRRGI